MGEKKEAKKRKNKDREGVNGEDDSEDNTEDDEEDDCLLRPKAEQEAEASSLLFLHLPYPLHCYQAVDSNCLLHFKAA